ncbi:hypothetical protein J2T60_002587 [Natronospira proteinivora]|uniref:DUF4236 domain-containing protein n=1 Tax=Natronospira proteinivora TaxID=1807133 RepID=A0ABT1GEA7_9GAMM|nr:DUF4236 domain-containing protein [Natronospira proteinivora]MCP1728573.1 hypothetical protein [Natronospira proteinivora]
MAFYLRKSVRFGLFRFNLSKSGVGISAVVKGFRVGSGPRGNYVHMGRGGLYYRAALPPEKGSTGPKRQSSNVPRRPVEAAEESDLQEISSAEASEVVDSTSAELVEEMNRKRKMIRLWPLAVAVALVGAYFVYSADLPDIAWVPYVVVAGLLIVAAAYVDRLRKTTVILYDLEEDAESPYKDLHSAFERLSGCAVVWHISAKGGVSDQKRNAGAAFAVERIQTNLQCKDPPYVKTNVPVMAIPVGKTTLYFFPDKVLLFQSGGVGAVSYSELNVSIESTTFVEDGALPKDAKVVDYTWQYVNKKGGPDKRFNNNRQLPIALYEDLAFSSVTGLNERIQLSRTGFGEPFKSALERLSHVSG